MAGDKNPFFGKHHTEGTKALIAGSNSTRVITEQTREKHRLFMLGRPHYTVSDEVRENMRRAHTGIPNGQLGRKRTEESKERMRVAHLLHSWWWWDLPSSRRGCYDAPQGES